MWGDMARKLVIVCPGNETPSVREACRALDVETCVAGEAEARSAEALVDYALREGARALLPGSPGTAELTVAAARVLNAPCMDLISHEDLLPRLAGVFRDSSKLRVAPCCLVADLEEAQAAAKVLTGTLWVRCTGVGSGRCARVTYLADLPLAINKGAKELPGRRMLVQQAIEGPVYRVPGFKIGREFRIVEIIAEAHAEAAFCVSTRYTLPSGLGAYRYSHVLDAAHLAGAALPPSHGLVELAFVDTKEGPVLVDARPTPCPDPVLARLLMLALGVDLVAGVIRVALDEEPVLSPTTGMAACAQWVTPHTGVVRAIHGVEAARALPGIKEVCVRARPGDQLGHVVDTASRDRLGHVLAVAPTRAEAVEAAQQAVDCIEVDAQAAT